VLALEGTAHPLATYLEHDVPVALATDDEGVLRTDPSLEYARAVLAQGIDSATLKRLTRNSLEYAFLPGESLWAERGRYRTLASPCAGERAGAGDPAPACAGYLTASRRAELQWRLESPSCSGGSSRGSRASRRPRAAEHRDPRTDPARPVRESRFATYAMGGAQQSAGFAATSPVAVFGCWARKSRSAGSAAVSASTSASSVYISQRTPSRSAIQNLSAFA